PATPPGRSTGRDAHARSFDDPGNRRPVIDADAEFISAIGAILGRRKRVGEVRIAVQAIDGPRHAVAVLRDTLHRQVHGAVLCERRRNGLDAHVVGNYAFEAIEKLAPREGALREARVDELRLIAE